MSKRDIETVATLAAHLALHGQGYMGNVDPADYADLGIDPLRPRRSPSQAAADAMRLQRLGRRARHMHWVDLWGLGWTPDSEDAPRIKALLDEVLRPYGLRGEVAESGVVILGLPGNTGGDESGYGI